MFPQLKTLKSIINRDSASGFRDPDGTGQRKQVQVSEETAAFFGISKA